MFEKELAIVELMDEIGLSLNLRTKSFNYYGGEYLHTTN
jgi:hypothetical protein